MRRTTTRFLATTILLAVSATVNALEPPTAKQLERYRTDGTFAARLEAARSFGNHRMNPRLAPWLEAAEVKALPDAPTVLPSGGSPSVLTLLIAFEDMAGVTEPEVVHERIYGEGEPAGYPYESLTSFYRRSSYGQLEITGSTLGWYTTPYPREDVVETYAGRQALIKEAITHFDDQGHDFSQYDNDDDGFIDYFVVIWTGEHGEWAEFWWGYQTSFWNDGFEVDGVQLSTYSWQWENYNWPGEFSPEVVIHETGHALGLPDYYDYDADLGPDGGVGGLDQMAGNWGDHNAYSKWVLGWLTPEIHNQGSHQLTLAPSDVAADAVVLMHGDPVVDPWNEYFLVQHRRREGNDAEIPNDGLLIWHVDARLGDDGSPIYDNSYTEHKLLRLMEADGLEEIESGGRADAGDFYTPGDLFNNGTTPSSNRYDGVPTNLAIDSVTEADSDISLQADLGSGCALWCDASVTPSAWPGIPVSFNGSLSTANCDGEASYGWAFGDGASSGDTSASHAYVSAGSWSWTVTAELEDALCRHQDSIFVCTDFRCWQWSPAPAMISPRQRHAAVLLDDGRVFTVAGNTSAPEIFDPATGLWSDTSAPTGNFEISAAAKLTDGRVLVAGSLDADTDDTQIYDPSTDTWSTAGSLNHDRYLHSAITLSDGRVMVAGGIWGTHPDYEIVEAIEVFDPASETWTVVGTLSGMRIVPALTNLHDGRALIVGAREATLFDPVSETLERAKPLTSEWQQPVAVTLNDGRVLMVGIADSARAFVWDPSDGTLRLGGSVGAIRQAPTATVLPDGLVLVAGGLGLSGEVLDSIEFFDPAVMGWSEGSSMGDARAAHAATLLKDGSLLLSGGAGPGAGNPAAASCEVLAQPASPPRGAGGRATP
ncbi:MAG: M6 family metalloprotease domain-containing protein [Thermoanaerobaculales bacterium]|nr:M6 family metalloprotease domain-containing protein [Thermoanaerobaculales bacterium]